MEGGLAATWAKQRRGPAAMTSLKKSSPRVYGLESRVKGLGFSKVNPTMENDMDYQNYSHTKNLGPE